MVNVANLTIAGLEMEPYTTVSLQLNNPLTVGKLDMFGGFVRGVSNGGQVQRGTLTLAAGAAGKWQGGWFLNADVVVTAGATLTIGGGGGGGAVSGEPGLVSGTLDVKGKLNWTGRDVLVDRFNVTQPVSAVHIESGGVFEITAAHQLGTAFGGATPNPDLLEITNDSGGKVVKNATSHSILNGNYTTRGDTFILSGTLEIKGSAEQGDNASRFSIYSGAKVALVSTASTLGIRNGCLVTVGLGAGTIEGNLALGNDPAAPGYNPQVNNTTPTVNPGGNALGTLNVTGDLRMFRGHLDVDVTGKSADGKFDRIHVNGTAYLGNAAEEGRSVFTHVLDKNDAITAADNKYPFLTYAARSGDFTVDARTSDPAGWIYGQDEGGSPQQYWVKPNADVAARKAAINGHLRQGTGLVMGALVKLLDATGTQVAATTTGADGAYQFANVSPDVYSVQFPRPTGLRFLPTIGGPLLDDDLDPLTGLLPVSVYADLADLDIGYYANSAPVATGDTVATPPNTAATGNVLSNDTDADLDTLTAAVATGPAHGTLALNPNGSFTYTPAAGYTGADSFTYTVADGYGGTATGSVAVTVAPVNTPPSAPNLSASAHAGNPVTLYPSAFDPDGDTVTITYSQGAHGSVGAGMMGFGLTYTPADPTYTGTDTFTYTASDGRGGTATGTVTVTLTNQPPVGSNYSLSATAGNPTIGLPMIYDPDGDVLSVTSISTPAVGSVSVSSMGLGFVYTAPTGFTGTVTFSYTVNDGHGGSLTIVVTVTVTA